MSAVGELEQLALSPGFPLANESRAAARVFDECAMALKWAGSDPGFEGKTGEGATALMTQQSSRAATSADAMSSAAQLIDAANSALSCAVALFRSLPSNVLPDSIFTGLLGGGWALFGPAGPMSGQGAVSFARAVLANRREREAITIIVDLEAELESLAERLSSVTGEVKPPPGGRPTQAPEFPADREEYDMTPWNLGTEWLSGKGNSREFHELDAFTQLLRQHPHYEGLREQLHTLVQTEQLSIGMSTNNSRDEDDFIELGVQTNYGLSGVEGVGKYVVDYSTLLTGGLTGNLAVTYLGSHNVDLDVIGQNPDGSYEVRFTASNQSTLESATRIPIVGYDHWYQNSIGEATKQFTEATGFARTTEQKIIWTETTKP